MATLTDAHTRDVTLKLQELLRKKLLASSGPSRAKTYTVPLPAQGQAIGQSSGQTSAQSGAGSGQTSEETSWQVAGSGQTSGQTSGQSSEDARQPRGWASIGAQGDAVLSFCSGGWRTLSEIAQAIGRAEETVRRHYLRPLLERGEIERRHPDNPQHPLQAYRTVKTQR